MDLESFLALERQRLADERERLSEYSDELISPREDKTALMQHVTVNSHTISEENLSKTTKDWFNQKQNDAEVVKDHKKKKKDDMEQWVSDTFYSYFPGFNNEYQKRQNELQKKILENQENLIRHQMLNTGQQTKRKKNHNVSTSHMSSARSNNSSVTSNGTATLHGAAAAKTDMEIINVNNPNYIPSKHSGLRPDSARYKLLQDLRHTTLTNIISGNAEDINRKQAELETVRKKEYQRELMQQIEDKRLSIKLLRDKELQQDEVLTRRLQEQLKTMNLEEQLEKERLKAVKARFDAEQYRLTREHLLAKLENDSKLLLDADLNIEQSRKLDLNNDMNKENRHANKVYKYFSNSEKHEYSSYRNKSVIPTEIDVEEDQTEIAKIEKECFHLSEKICPVCDGPLKELDNFCLCCQNKLSFRLKLPTSPEMGNQNAEKLPSKSGEDASDTNSPSALKEKDRSFFMVCVRCESLYSWCTMCASKSDVCRACQNKRNLCMNCRKTLCSFCLEEVACGKDIESLHINDSASVENDKMNTNTYSSKESSFHVMNDHEKVINDNKGSNLTMFSPDHRETSLNNLESYNHHPPYSMNIEQNSIFHPNHKPSLFAVKADPNIETLQKQEHNFSFLGKENTENFIDIDDKNIERLRRDNDKKLSRYLRNYGDFAYHSRGTQTTPNSSARRDVVLQGEHSLSIPLLREMPKMTRIETIKFKENSKDLENLQRRWDIPAVQKYTISQVSPRVVTQVGAIRKQLQVENIFSDDGDS